MSCLDPACGTAIFEADDGIIQQRGPRSWSCNSAKQLELCTDCFRGAKAAKSQRPHNQGPQLYEAQATIFFFMQAQIVWASIADGLLGEILPVSAAGIAGHTV